MQWAVQDSRFGLQQDVSLYSGTVVFSTGMMAPCDAVILRLRDGVERAGTYQGVRTGVRRSNTLALFGKSPASEPLII